MELHRTLVEAGAGGVGRAPPQPAKQRRLAGLAFADQHELATAGNELLEINKEHATHLASGWVAARLAGASAYLWYPLDRCCIRVVEGPRACSEQVVGGS